VNIKRTYTIETESPTDRSWRQREEGCGLVERNPSVCDAGLKDHRVTGHECDREVFGRWKQRSPHSAFASLAFRALTATAVHIVLNIRVTCSLMLVCLNSFSRPGFPNFSAAVL